MTLSPLARRAGAGGVLAAGALLMLTGCLGPADGGGAAAASAAALTGAEAPAPAPGPARIMAWPDLLQRPRPAASATLRYGDDPLQIVDVWVPDGPGPHPAVIMIHGGCWQTDIAERDIMNYIAEDLRRDGIGVWNIEYRGVDRPGGGWPGTYADVGAAADLFAARGGDYGLDTSRTLAIGHSAGGHLALWLAARPALARDNPLRGADPVSPVAAISQGGLPDLRAGMQRAGHPCGTEAPAAMAGDGRFAETSPPEMPLGEAAMILFNTDRDRIAPPAYAEAFRALMERRGAAVETHTHGPEGHVELIAPDSKSWAAQKARVKELLAR